MIKPMNRRNLFKGLMSGAAFALLPNAVPAFAEAGSLGVQALQRALAGDFSTAGNLAKQSGDQAAIKLVELFYLRDHGQEAGFARITAFLHAAPGWPLAETLMKRAEQALYDNKESAAVVKGHFTDRKPLTPYGMLALARAHYGTGDADGGKTWLRTAWASTDVDAEFEKKILAEFGEQLATADHRLRFSRLVYAQEPNAAIRMAKKLGGDYVDAAAAAQALIDNVGGADKKYNALSSPMKNELSLKYALTRYYRKQEEYGKVRAILASVPADAAVMGDCEAWWMERKIAALHSVGPTHVESWNAAYQIVHGHSIASGDSAIEAEFMSGWIALRYLKKPQLALDHFTKLQKLAVFRNDQARADYWMGRTHAVLGQKAAATEAYKRAAENSTMYYGQLAREQIGLGNKPENVSTTQASSTANASVEHDEVVRAFRLMAQVGTKNQLNIFLWSLANRFDSAAELNAVANIVQDLGGTSWSLRFAKSASLRGIDIDEWSYPLHGLPNWTQIGKPVERSLVFALSRQESEFDPNAGSSVGAQGLMQLMPGTAKLIAQQYSVPFAVEKLKSDPSYNVKLGAAHLADLVDQFSGSYVLTLVAYNAGPRRAHEWVDEYGDPRGGQVDAIDWVESIPFNETRQYVQKVMQNVHVYRARLAPNSVHPMSVDLKRGTSAEMDVASTSKVDPSDPCHGVSLNALISACN